MFIQLVTITNLFPFEVIQNANIINFVHYGKTRIEGRNPDFVIQGRCHQRFISDPKNPFYLEGQAIEVLGSLYRHFTDTFQKKTYESTSILVTNNSRDKEFSKTTFIFQSRHIYSSFYDLIFFTIYSSRLRLIIYSNYCLNRVTRDTFNDSSAFVICIQLYAHLPRHLHTHLHAQGTANVILNKSSYCPRNVFQINKSGLLLSSQGGRS